jgi:mutator protein MutT
MDFSATFLQGAAAALRANPPDGWDRSDDDMNERAQMIPKGIVPKPAAVLVPIVQRHELTVLLTKRHDMLKKHAGQIAFPGGKIDPGETALQAALREAHEEIGLAQQHVSPLGYLNGYLTVTGFVIYPVVALVQPDFTLQLQEDEVDAAFEVPFSFLMSSANREIHTRQWQGLSRQYYAYTYQDRYIWGATAGILNILGETLYGAPKSPPLNR